MSSKTLCLLVRVSVIAVACCGLFVCGFLLPVQGTVIVKAEPDLASWFWPWMIFLWVVSLPCFAILILIWKVSTAIKQDKVFTSQTAKWIKSGALLLFADIGAFLAGNAVFAILGMSGPPIVITSCLIIVFGITLAVFAAILSRYIAKAAILREENEGTV